MRKRVLVVEDDEAIRATIKLMLEDEGYVVEEAPDGEKGVKVLHEKKDELGLIIIDLVMPVMDGRQFIEHMEKCGELKHIPAFVITAANHLIPTIPPGIRYLSKPFDVEVFLAYVHEMTGFRRAAS